MDEGLNETQIAEMGGEIDGKRVTLNRRLFIQLLAFGECRDVKTVIEALEIGDIPAVVYEDVNDSLGIAIVVIFEAPECFLTDLRPVLQVEPFSKFRPKPELTMFGRTYVIGYEKDLEHTLLRKPFERLSNPDLQWSVWYPLRRRGIYESLSLEEQTKVQQEHMQTGFSLARAGHIADVRLACHGLGSQDNDFILGLLGPKLHPLSLVVQRMRKSRQTSLYLETIGPFFVGRAVGRTLSPDSYELISAEHEGSA